MKKLSNSFCLFEKILMPVILACAVYALLPRVSVENSNRNVAILTDFREVHSLAMASDKTVDEVLSMLKEKGLSGIMVSELTGDDIIKGFSQLELTTVRSDINSEKGFKTLISIPESSSYAGELASFTALRIDGNIVSADKGGIGILCQFPVSELMPTGVVPDLEGLKAAERLKLPVFYRPAPALSWHTQNALNVLAKVISDYPSVAVIAPSGESALGYPDMKPLADLCKANKLPVAQLEFTRQLGSTQLEWLSCPALLPLHSVTNEELLTRQISRQTLIERLARAAKERSVRLLMLRPSSTGNIASPLENYAGEIKLLADELKGYHFIMGWPETLLAKYQGSAPFLRFLASFACSGAFLLSLLRYCRRMRAAATDDEEKKSGLSKNVFFVVLAVVLASAAWKLSFAGRILGVLTAVFLATEASLIAMDLADAKTRLWKQLLLAFVFTITGGLAIAAFFSQPLYMLRLQTFSGVKLTLLLPPLLVFLHDFKNRIHPESLTGFLSRPPLWGELCLCGLLVIALAFALLRSDNVKFISGFEVILRNFLENTLVARPRTREILIGYPSLFMLAFALRSRLWAHYRELLRIGVVLGFSSVVNSFCHFHTPMLFTLLREFNGLWLGSAIGIAAVIFMKYVILPIWEMSRFIVE